MFRAIKEVLRNLSDRNVDYRSYKSNLSIKKQDGLFFYDL